MSYRLWQRYPQVTDPADRDNVIDIVLRRLADHEEKHGPAQNLPALIRRVFPEAVAKVLRKSYYRLRLVPLEDMPRLSEAAHATQAGIESDINTHDFLKMLDKRSRQVVYRRIIRGQKPNEIAAVMGLSVGNVRVICHRAIEQLKRML